ncbi:Hypothetical protein (Fragment) [Durusdinium trenchii]|uniref:Rhodanese domain-containing protein n=1 Tax=Durusdinium trenchii TaxID=1381693 RepID=A0ABP0KFT5_9DINO
MATARKPGVEVLEPCDFAAAKLAEGLVDLHLKMQKYANQWAKYPLVVLFCQHSADRAPQHAGWFKNHARQGQRVAIMRGGFRGWQAARLPIA